MSNTESSSSSNRLTRDNRPRHPQREIADLLAAAILRMHADPPVSQSPESSTVCLAITADQSVHVNPSYQEGVQP